MSDTSYNNRDTFSVDFQNSLDSSDILSWRSWTDRASSVIWQQTKVGRCEILRNYLPFLAKGKKNEDIDQLLFY